MSQKPNFGKNNNNSKELVNQKIRFEKVLVIDDDGAKLGEMSSYEANALATSKNLDLYCVAPNLSIPVCKICNFGKLKYEMSKSQKENKKKQSQTKLKEIRIKTGIASNDLNTKARHAIEFLKSGDRVKLSLKMFGRQLATPEIGFEKINQFLELVKDYGQPEAEVKKVNNFFDIIIIPKK